MKRKFHERWWVVCQHVTCNTAFTNLGASAPAQNESKLGALTHAAIQPHTDTHQTTHPTNPARHPAFPKQIKICNPSRIHTFRRHLRSHPARPKRIKISKPSPIQTHQTAPQTTPAQQKIQKICEPSPAPLYLKWLEVISRKVIKCFLFSVFFFNTTDTGPNWSS